jgi:hypothetical protein
VTDQDCADILMVLARRLEDQVQDIRDNGGYDDIKLMESSGDLDIIDALKRGAEVLTDDE